MPTSVRLDAETETLLKRLARESGRSKSQVLRDALDCLAETSGRAAGEDDLYAQVSDLVGIVEGGPDTPAREHKRAWRNALRGKHGR